jgi:hypothetical protein
MQSTIRGLLGVALSTVGLGIEAGPVPPCSATGSAVVPLYADLGDPPTVGIWHGVEIGRVEPCLGAMPGRMKLVVALAGRFRSTRSIEEIAGRVGAVSSTRGLRYWSTTEGRWRTLVADAFALESRDAESRRADFTPAEILSGRILHFAQRDTRSTSLNVYSLSGRLVGHDRLAIEVINITTIRVFFFPLFESKALLSLHFFERLEPDIWGYYGISAIGSGSIEGHEKSLVNRAAAAYRFFKNVPADRDPPLAP